MPVARYLPGLRIPERGRAITLQDLALHISGLPRDPPPIARTPEEHFAAFDLPRLQQFLESYQLDRDVGEKFEYSNVGVGLLGLALENALSNDYQDLVRLRITRPLGMEDTSEISSRRMRVHLSEGHNRQLEVVSPHSWSHPYRAAGSLRSTTDDLLKLLGAQLGFRSTELQPALARMLAIRHETGIPGLEAALGWSVATDRGMVIASHSGITAGFTTFIGFEPNLKMGVVVMSNALASVLPDDIGLHLLNPRYKLAEKFSNH
jgi:serine-type D-Ala-D-Ala carboxypeptidase/endopeptidase